MENYRKGSHAIYALIYHLVRIVKYRKKVLIEAVAKRVRELIRQICEADEIDILKGHIAKDHVHILYQFPSSFNK